MSARKSLPGPEGGNDLAEALARRLAGSGARPEPDGGRPHIREERAATPPPEAVPEMDDTALLSRWRWQLGATARKAAATRVKADVAMADWERLVVDAEKAGVPVRLVVAAAADAGMDI